MTLVESREDGLWGLRWMQDAVQNSGKTKPGFYPVIGLFGGAGKLGKICKQCYTLEHCSAGENLLHQSKNFSYFLSLPLFHYVSSMKSMKIKRE